MRDEPKRAPGSRERGLVKVLPCAGASLLALLTILMFSARANALEVQTGQPSSAVKRAQIARVLNDAIASWFSSESMENKQAVYQTAMLTQAAMILLSRQPGMDPKIARSLAAGVLQSFGLQAQP